MTPAQAKLFAPLVKALGEGKTIEFFNPLSKDWESLEEPEFDSPAEQYRIKPDSVRIQGILNAYFHPTKGTWVDGPFCTKADAEACRKENFIGIIPINCDVVLTIP